jgi:translocation and assembly module TamB
MTPRDPLASPADPAAPDRPVPARGAEVVRAEDRDASGNGVPPEPPEPPELPEPPEPTEDESEEVMPRGMSRRKLVALVSGAALLILGALLALVIVLGTQTSYGRDYIRSVLLDLTKGARGRVYIGHIGGNLFTGVTIDSLEMRDTDDSVFVATGPVRVTYDPRDFIDRRVLLRHVRVERPVVTLRKNEQGSWNWRRLFPSGPPRAKRAERGFGDFIVIDSADVVDGQFVLAMPWHPADSLGTGARRDSAVRANLSDAQRCDSVRCWGEIRPNTATTFMRTWRWTGMTLSLAQARIKDPDSTTRHFEITRLTTRESDPPMRIKELRGTVRQLADSAWIDFPHFALTSSAGSATGKVIWGDKRVGDTKVCEGVLAGVKYRWEQRDGCPVRYDVAVHGARVAMDDINWVFPPLPQDGGGSMDLQIRTDPRNLRVIDYRLTNLDVRSRFSHLRGAMTFAVGGPVLVLKDVAVNADPVDFRLLRHINQEPFPYPWAGTITGRVVARGGPVNRWKVDSARFVFRDANVPGAMTTGQGRGELDILFPAFTAFHGFRIDVERLDLATLQFLNPEFPRVNGYVQGSATLDSSWLDVRFRDAQLAHVDGPGEPTRATGSGRATIEEKYVRYDLELALAPLNLTMLARSYTGLPARGLVSGPIRVKGISEALEVATDLSGAAGRMTFDGTLDSYPPGYAIRGGGRLEGLDPRRLLEDAAVPEGSINATWTADVRGDTTTNLEGRASIDLARSLLAGVRLYDGAARLAFTPGRLRVDSLALETSAAKLAAFGGLGLTAAVRDSLRFAVDVDSLGGLRRWLTFTPPGDVAVPDDTLGGSLRLRGTLAGSIDTSSTLALAATLAGDELRMGQTRVQRVTGRATLADVLRRPAGTLALRADTIVTARTGFTAATLDVGLEGLDHARMLARLDARNGVRMLAAGEGGVLGDTVRMRVDSLNLDAASDRWRLAAPATVVRTPGLTQIGAMRLEGTQGGRLAFGGRLPDSAGVDLRLEAAGLPLATLGLVAQSPTPYAGRLSASVGIEGTRDRPSIALTGALDSASFGGVALQRVTTQWTYADRQATGQVALLRGGAAVLTARGTLPVDLSLRTVSRRLVDGVPLALNVRSEQVDLALVESFSPSLEKAQGTFEANLDVRGTWRRPTLSGRAGVADGAVTLANVGVRLQRMAADLEFRNDSLVIHRVHAETESDRERRGALDVRGGIGYADLEHPGFDIEVSARDFAVMRKARSADIDVSTIAGQPIRLVGSNRGARLTGGVEVARADIYIPEFSGKQVQSLDDPDLYNLVDTSLFTDRRLLPDAPSELVRNLRVEDVQVRMGDDVWLRSTEASIKLGGAVRVTVGRDQRDESRSQLALTGALNAERGTYRLDLGILQRTFTVEGGTLTFYGDADLNPALDIRALHVVRQFEQNRSDVPVRVTIGGTLAQPTLTLSSADAIYRSPSDLLSYLITGQPNLEEAVATTNAAANTAVNLGITSLSSVLERKIGVFDLLTVQTGGANIVGAGQASRGFSDAFWGSRLTGGKQLGDRVFVSLSVGACGFRQIGQGGSLNAGQLDNVVGNIGTRVEWRLPSNFAVTGSAEPSASELACNQAGISRGVLISPRQLGVDFSKRWEF